MSTLAESPVSISTKASSRNVVEAYYTICPVYVASNVAVELGWLEEEFQRAGAKLNYLRSLPENIGWLPHFSHKLDNLFRDGGNIPSIWAKADNVDTKLIGLTAGHDGGQILVRADSGLNRVADLRGRKIALPKSLNTGKVDWWRGTAERGVELALQIAGLSRQDVQIVDAEHADNVGLGQGSKPTELWVKRRLKNDFNLFSPEIEVIRSGKVDAIYSNHGRSQTLQRSGEFKAIEDLSRHPDWTLQVANSPWAITVNTELANKHPEVLVAYLRAAIRAGRWINANRAAAAEILHRVGFAPNVADTFAAIAQIDFVPNLSAQNIAGIEIEKQFLFSHGYIKRDFDVRDWAAPHFLAEAYRGL